MRAPPNRRHEDGLTIIEVMVVLVIMGLLGGGAVYGLGMLTRASLRSASMKIIAAARFAYQRSVSHGTTIRISFDMDKLPATIAIEEAHGRITLARASDDSEDKDDRERADVDPWAAAQERLKRPLKPSLGASAFGPITNADGDPIKLYRPSPLDDRGRVRLVKFFARHEPEPRERGTASLYFFPQGRATRAVIWLTDGSNDGKTIYAVEIDGMTGRGTVYTEAYEPEAISEDATDEERSAVEAE